MINIQDTSNTTSNTTLPYRILTTGSHGNCIRIDNILLDAGLTKKKLTALINPGEIEYLFISHPHADHLNLPLVRYFIEQGVQCFFPHSVALKIEGEGKLDPNAYVNVTIFGEENNITNNKTETFICGDNTVTAIPQKHWDIVNYAFIIENAYKERILYSTDLDTLSPSTLGKGLHHLGLFDIIFLEGNYDEEWLREYIVTSIGTIDDDFDYNTLTSDELNTWVRNNYRNIPKDMAAGLFRAVQNMRHLSKQQARNYVHDHLKPNGKYYEIHRSSMFYERPNDWDGMFTVDLDVSSDRADHKN